MVDKKHLSGRILITGCSSGIGQALAIELVARGHRVVATARSIESVRIIRGADHATVDVTSQESVDAVAAAYTDISVLVNNAGLGMWGPVEAVEIDAARHIFDTNVLGPMRMAKALLPAMRARGHGLVLQISSAAGRSTSPLVGYYSASKHALEAVSEALRIEVATFGVKVSCVSLGAVVSALGEKRYNFDDDDYAAVTKHFRARLMAKRRSPTTSQDAARAIADIVEEGGLHYRYDATEDSRTLIRDRRALTDEAYEAGLLEGLI